MQNINYPQIEYPKNTKSFGTMPDGKEVLCYTLTNKKGMEVSIINYGATITSIKIPVTGKEKVDVVLGFDNLQSYIDSFELPSAPYFGAVVGRFAGRIANAQFKLNNEFVHLDKNHSAHHLHGGKKGFSQRYWELKSKTEGDYPSITLSYMSQNNEENYPGIFITEVTYILTESNQLIVEYNGHCSEDTVANLTQHTYFNLDRHTEQVTNQLLSVFSEAILETNEENIPNGKFILLKDTAFDFSIPKNVPETIDNTFTLAANQKIAARLSSSKNNLQMTVLTNQPAVHIYVGGNCFGKIPGKENAAYDTQSGICFETQNYPDAPNHFNFPSAILKHGERYHHQTIFAFEKI